MEFTFQPLERKRYRQKKIYYTLTLFQTIRAVKTDIDLQTDNSPEGYITTVSAKCINLYRISLQTFI